VRQIVLALALLPFIPSPAAPFPARIPPIDQCKGDPSFTKFLTDLKHTVAKKDRPAFLSLLAPDVLVDFGGGTGSKAFEDQWKFDPTEYGNLWDQLETMLKMGCAKDGGSRIIPSLPMQVDQDVAMEWVVILPGAKLYKMVGELSPKPQTIPWTVATVTSRASDTMTGVRLPDGRDPCDPFVEISHRLGGTQEASARGGVDRTREDQVGQDALGDLIRPPPLRRDHPRGSAVVEKLAVSSRGPRSTGDERDRAVDPLPQTAEPLAKGEKSRLLGDQEAPLDGSRLEIGGCVGRICRDNLDLRLLQQAADPRKVHLLRPGHERDAHSREFISVQADPGG